MENQARPKYIAVQVSQLRWQVARYSFQVSAPAQQVAYVLKGKPSTPQTVLAEVQRLNTQEVPQ